MLLEAGIAVLGVLAGILTGITPGIHPNTVIFTSLPIYFGTGIDFMLYLSFIAALSVSHTFHDFLPSIFLGAPEGDTALASVAGADMAEEGRGLEAFYYTIFGGFVSCVVMLFLSPLLLLFLSSIYSIFNSVMFYVLVFFQLVIVFNSRKVFYGFITAFLSGILGFLAFSMPVNSQNVLMPVFAGLFAVPTFLSSFQPTLEDQKPARPDRQYYVRGGALGTVAGIMTGIFPGVTGTAATSFFAPLMSDKVEEFLAAIGAVNTSDILISFLGLYLIEKARSGTAVALNASALLQVRKYLFFLECLFSPSAYRFLWLLECRGTS